MGLCLYMPALSFFYCIFQSHVIYSFQYFLLSTFSTRWRWPFNQIIVSEPSSFFVSIYTASFHPQTSTLTHEPWPSPPKVRNECFNVDACASFRSLLKCPLLHFFAFLRFAVGSLFVSNQNLFRLFHEITCSRLFTEKKNMVERDLNPRPPS